MISPRYIEVPAADLRGCLRDIGQKVEAKGGAWRFGTQGREVVFSMDVPQHPTQVRVYTSLAQGDDAVRGCGKDAVRVCVGCITTDGRFKPLRPSRKVLRTAPKGEPEARVQAFLDRLTQVLRDAYAQALSIPVCPKCASPMAERQSKNGPFWGCLGYPETCHATLPMKEAS